MHSIRPVGSLNRARIGDRLVHSAHKLEHDMIPLKRELLLDFDALDQFLCIRSGHRSKRILHKDTYRRSPEEQSVISLRTIKVCSPSIAREGFDTLLERQDVPDHLPDTVRVRQTDAFSFPNQEMFK